MYFPKLQYIMLRYKYSHIYVINIYMIYHILINIYVLIMILLYLILMIKYSQYLYDINILDYTKKYINDLRF